jgi:cyanophycin synthetase
VSVTGTNGKTSTTRMIGQVLAQAGLRVGVSCTDGVYVGGDLVYEADASGPRSAEMVLDNATVEAAVLETARGGIVRRGLGYDVADVAVVTNVTLDHVGDDGVADFGELVSVKALVAEQIKARGCVVLNADDAASAGLADRRAVRARNPVLRLFSTTQGNPMIERHRAAGGACYEVIDGQLTETVGGERRPLLPVADLPGAFGGRAAHMVANALAAVAACRALGVTAKDIARGLAAFDPAAGNPGRSSFFRAGGSPVIVDYGHNGAALEATGRFLRDVFGTAPVAAVTLPGDRQDDVITNTARAVAAWFGPVVLYEDSDKRGRETGEMIALIEGALRAAQPGITVQHAENPADALRAALRLAGGRPVLFLYEKLTLARDALAAVGAEPWPEAEAGPSAAPSGSADPEAAGAAVAAAAAVVQNAVLGAAEDAAADATLAQAAAATAIAADEGGTEAADPEAAAAGAAAAAAAVADMVARDGSADYDTLAALSGPASP